MTWTHPICAPCYSGQQPSRAPFRLKGKYRDDTEPCCWCGNPTDGIYLRADPAFLLCKGNHGEKD